MNLTLTQLNQPAASARSAAPAAASDAAAPAAATIDAAGAAPAPADGTQPAAAQPALGFAQWLGLDPLAAPIAEAPAAPVETAPLETDAPADEQAAADTPLLGAMAMAMPLMPVAQATLAAVVAALPGVPAPKESAPVADTGTSQQAAPAGQGREGKIELAALPAAMPVARASVEAAASAAAKPAAAALPAEALAVNANADAAQEQSAPALDRTAANSFGVAAPAPGAAQRTGDTVTLSGPPTAWRQTLQEALGERLQLQVGKSADQAVIRLEPPMLGRVEIAIRHSAGSLEVHISATHGEVLRQLQTVSEGLRNDLAQRQFSDVSVNIAPAPRGAAGANNTPMFAGGDGRGRQQDGRQQEQGPGEALAEANTGSSPFSLNGRGHGFT
ncbi:flagellar hook-length control protein FliK [Massilia suwonensis]|uniref:Flagellar hook-length control protein FliK n=1 Tax=Massilia suwonensis TaxID=648895 RepID=A0ABW0MIF3_9BURK